MLRHDDTSRVFSLRGLAVVLLLLSYLSVGVLHAACETDITGSNTGHGSVVLMTASKAVDQSDKAINADHHCHGCFSVSMPHPATIAVAAILTPRLIVARTFDHHGLVPGVDPPPPKFLI